MDERKEEAKATRCLFCMYFAHILGVKLYKWWVGGMTATVKKKEYPMRSSFVCSHRQSRHFLSTKSLTHRHKTKPTPTAIRCRGKKETEIQPQPQPATNQVSVHTYRSIQPRTKKNKSSEMNISGRYRYEREGYIIKKHLVVTS